MNTQEYRKKWNLDKYAKELEEKTKNREIAKKKANKQAMDLKSKVKIGKVNIVNPANLKNAFYCSICDVLKHDSLSYQSHITSKAHMKNIGQDLAVHRSTVAQIRDRLNGAKSDGNKKSVPAKKPETVKKPTPKSNKEDEEPVSAEDASIKLCMGFNHFGRAKQQ